MQDQIGGIAGLETLEVLQPLSWKAAVGEYERSWPIRHADLRTHLAARILRLTGRQISSGEIYADGLLAVASVDGVTFWLHNHSLVLVRACTYCGTGRFESPKIGCLLDLGTRSRPGGCCTRTARTIRRTSYQNFEQGDFAMPIEENKAVVRRFFEELLSTDNFAVADEILSPGFRFYFAGSPDPMDLERYKQFLVARRAAFPDRRFVVEDMIAEGEKVSARFTMRGTNKGEFRGIAPSGTKVTMTGIDMIRLAEGKMVEDRVEVDQLGMMQQLGVMPSPQRAEA